MKKLLLIGIDTRSMLNSALKLDYEIYSTSYFSTQDTPTIKNQKIILKENYGESCGEFENQFDSQQLLEVSYDYIDEVDYIIPISGVSPTDFSKKDRKKILGNKDIGKIENKFEFFKEIENKFLTPMTFCISDIDEVNEINKSHPNTQFILKPLQGSGGYGVQLADDDINLEFNDRKFIMQEYVNGINLSSSVLSNKNEAKTIINSRLLTENDFENNDSFIYIGNIVPLTTESIMIDVEDIAEINSEMKDTSEKLSKKFNLIGSNGVDYILNENGLYVIEINPRIQGTFECVEKSLGINMLEAHIKACKGEIIDVGTPQYYSYKKIIYSPVRNKYKNIDLDNIYDLPHVGSITEKSEPLLIIIDKDKDFEKLYKKVESSSQIVNAESIKHQQGIE
ncbi:MAG: ATP-grasp domain-containing protein [Methanobrevibacter sp.]|nr:ATP-grasp domain-containing protein [Methanobrevibacter sp.]